MEIAETEQNKIQISSNQVIQSTGPKELKESIIVSESQFEPCTGGGCDMDLCVPGIVRNGFLGSIWTWVVIIITIGVIWTSIALINTNMEWYKSLNKPTALISSWGFVIVWTILYIGLTISIILASWKEHNPRSGCMVLLYVLIILLTLLWIIAFMQLHMLGLGIVILVLILLLILWLIWLVTPPRNSSGGWFPHVFLWIFFFWIILALYYNISFLILNPDV